MPVDMPPQIPPAVIEYVKEHDYLPDDFKNAAGFYEYINHYLHKIGKFKEFEMYQHAYHKTINENPNMIVGNYIILHNAKETRFASENEVKKIVKHYPELSPSNVPPKVIDFVNKYGNVPKEYQNLNIYNAQLYIKGLEVNYNENFKYYNGYLKFYVGYPITYNYNKNKCQIVLYKDAEVRCATEPEFNEIAKNSPDMSPSGIPLAIIDFVNKYDNTSKEYKNLNIHNAHTYISGPAFYYPEGKVKYYKEYLIYYLNNDSKNIYQKGQCSIVLHNFKETRCTTADENFELTVVGADSSYVSGTVIYYLLKHKWFAKKLELQNYRSKNKGFYSIKDDNGYNNYNIYYVCYGDKDKHNIKLLDKCAILLDNSKETRLANMIEKWKIRKKNRK